MDKLLTRAEIEKTDKGLLAVASTAVEDRHGEVVSVEGWDLKSFKKNPVLLWAHDHYSPAIGVAKNIKVEGVGKKARLIFEPVFHDLTEQARALKSMVEEGIINSFSVGFRPIEMEENVYIKQELLEVSLVNVPANPDARMLAFKSLKKAGFEDEVIKDVGAWVEEKQEDDTALQVQDLASRIETMSEAYGILEGKYEEVVKVLKHINPQGRKSEVVTQRLALHKVVARASDKILESKPSDKTARYAKVIKRASQKLIEDHKQELKLNGKN